MEEMSERQVPQFLDPLKDCEAELAEARAELLVLRKALEEARSTLERIARGDVDGSGMWDDLVQAMAFDAAAVARATLDERGIMVENANAPAARKRPGAGHGD